MKLDAAITKEEHRELKRVALEREQPVSKIVARLVRSYLDQEEKAGKRTT